MMLCIFHVTKYCHCQYCYTIWNSWARADITNEDNEKMHLKKEIVLLQIQLYSEYGEYLDILLRDKFLLNPCMKNNIRLPHNEKNIPIPTTFCFPSSLEYTLIQAQLITWFYWLFECATI